MDIDITTNIASVSSSPSLISESSSHLVRRCLCCHLLVCVFWGWLSACNLACSHSVWSCEAALLWLDACSNFCCLSFCRSFYPLFYVLSGCLQQSNYFQAETLHCLADKLLTYYLILFSISSWSGDNLGKLGEEVVVVARNSGLKDLSHLSNFFSLSWKSHWSFRSTFFFSFSWVVLVIIIIISRTFFLSISQLCLSWVTVLFPLRNDCSRLHMLIEV